MSCPINGADLEKLKVFISFCNDKPELLNMPELVFLKNFVEKLGGNVPEGVPQFEFGSAKPMPMPTKAAADPPAPEEAAMESEESDVDLDNEGCVEPDMDEPQIMGDSNKEPTDEEMDQASEIRSKAATAFSDGNFPEAIALYTQAIEINPSSSLFYAKRGQAFLKQNKPNACIRDCDRALELNCDSATAFKFRGRANRLLGNWESSAKDLRQACKLDYDEQADEWLREVTPNAKKLEQHRVKQERRTAEKELKARQERVRQAQESARNANANANSNAKANSRPSARAGAGAGTGGAAAGAGADDGLADLLRAFQDPEISEAFKDIMLNPANIIKYQNNPKVMKIIQATQGADLFGGLGGAAAGAFANASAGSEGFAANAGGFAGTKPKPPTADDLQDDGLD